MGDLLKIAKDLSIPLVGTNDLHYTHQHDATSHAALLCVQSGSTLDDPKRFKFDGDGYYVKSPAEMRQVFRDHPRSEEHTSELQSLMRNSYAVFCLKTKK